MRLLVVNGNTTQAVTDAACAEARRACAQGTTVEGATARFGADIVTTYAGEAVAAHAVIDILAERAGTYDAAVLAISFDSGLDAARDLFDVPIVGMTQAALMAACAAGGPVAMLTFGASAVPLYERLLRTYGLADRVAALRCIDVSPAAYLSGSGRDDAILAEVAAMPQGLPVVLCGAALAGTAARLQPRSDALLFDGIACAVAAAEREAASPRKPRTPATVRVSGLSPALTGAFGGHR